MEGVPAHGKGGWNQMIFKVPSNLNHSMILRLWYANTAYYLGVAEHWQFSLQFSALVSSCLISPHSSSDLAWCLWPLPCASHRVPSRQ